MSKNTAKLFLRFFFSLLAIFCVSYFLFRSRISADSDLGKLNSKKEIVLEMNGKQEKFELRQYRRKDQILNYLFKKSFYKTGNILLPGFEDEVTLCEENVIKTDGKDLICFIGDVGVHSKNLVLVNYSKQKMRLINFSGNELSQNLTSDVPFFQFNKDENGNLKTLYCDNRDYDKDPIENSLRDIYKIEDGSFIFDKEEEVTYN